MKSRMNILIKWIAITAICYASSSAPLSDSYGNLIQSEESSTLVKSSDSSKLFAKFSHEVVSGFIPLHVIADAKIQLTTSLLNEVHKQIKTIIPKIHKPASSVSHSPHHHKNTHTNKHHHKKHHSHHRHHHHHHRPHHAHHRPHHPHKPHHDPDTPAVSAPLEVHPAHEEHHAEHLAEHLEPAKKPEIHSESFIHNSIPNPYANVVDTEPHFRPMAFG